MVENSAFAHVFNMYRPIEPENQEIDTRLIWAGLFFSLAIFSKFPIIDVLVLSKFYIPGTGFLHASNGLVASMYTWLPRMASSVISAVVGMWLVAALAGQKVDRLWTRFGAHQGPDLKRTREIALLAMTVLLLAPGLISYLSQQPFMIRPTPDTLQVFGGSEIFWGIFEQGTIGAHGTSRINVASAMGFALMALGMSCEIDWKRRWLQIGLLTGSAIGLAGMLLGKVFLSDVIFAFYLVWISYVLTAKWVMPWLNPARHA